MTEYVTQPDSFPTRKVTAATLGASVGAALSQIIVNVIDAHVPLLAGADVAALIYTVVPGLVAYGLGWFVKERAKL